jgi:hypothetical protein
MRKVRVVGNNVLSRGMSLAFVGGLALLGASGAHADAIAFDTTDILANVQAAVTFITTVGLAVLAMLFVAKGIKWVRKAG